MERADDVKLWTFNRFREVAQGYDIVICDTPASLGPVTNATAIVADVVLVPMKPLPADVWAAVQTKLLLDEADGQRAQWGSPQSVASWCSTTCDRARATWRYAASSSSLWVWASCRCTSRSASLSTARSELANRFSPPRTTRRLVPKSKLSSMP